ncbi:hypothetical protein AURDEDRAFT_139027 [Auricularia subglabra TFB-10046 SS5]|nr:hypothetical protein AURDEDRAFT_139027 [Auricularia subglabra TFB-10046 SS5]
MKQMWQACRSYFGDGFVPGSSPLRFDVHICDIERPPPERETHYYGVEIDEDAFPLFTALGDARPPPCSCHDSRTVAAYIADRLEQLPTSHPEDYALHTGKGDTSADVVAAYIMRDALSWWSHWHGSLAGHRWKHLYIAQPDQYIPPRHIVDGTWRYLGHTLSEVLDGLLSEGMHPDDVQLAEMLFWRGVVLQYLEKVDPGLRALVLGKTILMTQFRTITANTHGPSPAVTH